MHVGFSFGSCGRIRTADLTIMSRALSPTELHSHVSYLTLDKIACEARRLFRPEPRPGIDPGTSILPRWRSTTELSGQRDKTLPTNIQKTKSVDSFML